MGALEQAPGCTGFGLKNAGLRRLLHRQRVHDRHVLVLRLVGQGGQLHLRARRVHGDLRPGNGHSGRHAGLRKAHDDGDPVDRGCARHATQRRVVRAERRVPRLPRQLHVLRRPQRDARRLQDQIRPEGPAHTPRLLDPQARRVALASSSPSSSPTGSSTRTRGSPGSAAASSSSSRWSSSSISPFSGRNLGGARARRVGRRTPRFNHSAVRRKHHTRRVHVPVVRAQGIGLRTQRVAHNHVARAVRVLLRAVHAPNRQRGIAAAIRGGDVVLRLPVLLRARVGAHGVQV